MSDLQRHDGPVWDRLFEFLYACDESVSDAEVDADLEQAGVDMRPAYRRLEMMIEQKKARLRFAQAKEIRASMLGKLKGVVAPKVGNLRASVHEFIDRLFTGPELVAHHHKLEKAATEDDLQTLMDDLHRLAALRQQAESKNEPPAK